MLTVSPLTTFAFPVPLKEIWMLSFWPFLKKKLILLRPKVMRLKRNGIFLTLLDLLRILNLPRSLERIGNDRENDADLVIST